MKELLAQVKALVTDKSIRLPLFIVLILAIVIFGFVKRKRFFGLVKSTRSRVRRRYSSVRQRYSNYRSKRRARRANRRKR